MAAQRSLTPRQSLILQNVARGMTNKDIAAQLGISEQGVKVHVSRLLERYGAENRVELINLSRAWPEAARSELRELSGDIAGIRADLNQTYTEATSLRRNHGGNGHSQPSAATNGRVSTIVEDRDGDLASEVRSLREGLAEINIALN